MYESPPDRQDSIDLGGLVGALAGWASIRPPPISLVRRLPGGGKARSGGAGFDVGFEVFLQHGAQLSLQEPLQRRAGTGDLGPKSDGPMQFGELAGLFEREFALVAGQW